MTTALEDPTPRIAFGAPGMEPRWTASTKEGMGTAYHTGCRLWYTISHGIINEIYYPHVDTPNTRDLQYLITDGESFFHEERRDLDHAIEYPEQGSLLYRLTNTDRADRYRIVKEVCADPHASVLLVRTRLEILDEALRGKLRLFVLIAPHLRKVGWGNSAETLDVAGRKLLHAWRDGLHLVMGATAPFVRRSVGYVGASDGWQDLQNFQMDWEFTQAPDGNVAMTAEVDLHSGTNFTLGVAIGHSTQSAAAKLLQSLSVPFASHRQSFVEQWRRLCSPVDHAEHTGDGGSMFRLSRCVLMAHEDKTFGGALVASMSIPWGEAKGDEDLGGYHLVWPRDLMQSAVGLLASGQLSTPRKALIWLACLQKETGALPQNSWIDGRSYWQGQQLDEVAAPVLLAWRLREAGLLGDFDPWILISRAAGHLMLNGPISKQERWEEAHGYSPSTLAAILAALVCASEFARESGEPAIATFILDYADWLSAHIEDWTVTTCGELVPGKPRHYIRVCPPHHEVCPEPDHAVLTVANGGGTHPARNIVGGDFLALVRFGLRDPHDPLMVDSVAVIDAVLKYDLPQGPCWLRYNHDGYGQKADGSPFDGTGVGGGWPLLTGERGQYELASGRDPLPAIHALEKFANEGGMLPEQVWCGGDQPGHGYKRGDATGSAMPLCWAHAEYLNLVRSRADGVPFDRVKPAYDRYVAGKPGCTTDIWTAMHPITRMTQGRTLRIVTAAPASVKWLFSNGTGGCGDTRTIGSSGCLGCAALDMPTKDLPPSAEVTFTVTAPDGSTSEARVLVV